MPRYERPSTSVLADFAEDVTAEIWGADDPLDGIPEVDAHYSGFYDPEPVVILPGSANRAEGGAEINLPLLGESKSGPGTSSDYYKRKIAAGLIPKPKL